MFRPRFRFIIGIINVISSMSSGAKSAKEGNIAGVIWELIFLFTGAALISKYFPVLFN